MCILSRFACVQAEMSMTTTANTTAQLSTAMLRWQVLVTMIVAVLSAVLSGVPAAISALLGGAAVILGAWVSSRIAARSATSQQAGAVLVNMLKAEAVKILIIAIVLFAVFKLYQALVPFALVAGLGAAALFSGAALAKSQANI